MRNIIRLAGCLVTQEIHPPPTWGGIGEILIVRHISSFSISHLPNGFPHEASQYHVTATLRLQHLTVYMSCRLNLAFFYIFG